MQAINEGGGAVQVQYVYGGLSLTSCTFRRNRSLRNGGALRTISTREATLIGCTFTDNKAVLGQVRATHMHSSRIMHHA